MQEAYEELLEQRAELQRKAPIVSWFDENEGNTMVYTHVLPMEQDDLFTHFLYFFFSNSI